MRTTQVIAVLFAALVASAGAEVDMGRKLLQTVYAGTPSTLTVSASNPNVNAITITLAIPYPQAAYYCNVTGDSRIPQQGPFPLTVRVPVGVTSTVIFANITNSIPGTSCQMASGGVVQQQGQGSSVVQQQSGSTSVQQMVNNPSSVVQQTSGGANVVQQQNTPSIKQGTPGPYMNCVSGSSSVVQQQSSPASVVQQQSSPASVVQQQTPSTTVKQPSPPTTVVQQPTPPTTVVQQPTPPTTVKQPSPPTTVVQQPSPPTTVVQQPSPPASVVQQQGSASSVVQQSTPAVIQQPGRHLLQAGTIEYISNNGSTGQPQLSVLDTTEGVPNISFKPTAAGQTAQFNGALQVAQTTTMNGFGQAYIPFRVDSKLSPQCRVQVNFVSF